MSPSPPARSRLSPTKRRAFIAVCALGPWLALALVEGMLRLLGQGGYDPILRPVTQTSQGTLMLADPVGMRGFFFANPDRPGYNNQTSFVQPKPAGTTRILMVGGSAIQGYPQSPRFSASSFLGEMLRDCWPDRSVEVINLGTTAVASFPVREILRQGLACQPDLVVVYAGHNEFYGAYGVASINRAGASSRLLSFQYRLRELALVQHASKLARTFHAPEADSLMEVMVDQDYLAPDDGKRTAAADLLRQHIGDMIRMCRDRRIPVVVCTLPGNERDLAPIGADRDGTDTDTGIASARQQIADHPEQAASDLRALLEDAPHHARAHFYLARALSEQGDDERARFHYVRARDLDPMPWRAPTLSQQGIRSAVEETDGQLCDVEDAFRRQSLGESIGWELMDDHVHLSLRGQALLARTLVEALAARTDALQVPREALKRLPEWQTYADRLGDNLYDRYAAAQSMCRLFDVPFMRESNPDAFLRFDAMVHEQETEMAPELQDSARRWQLEQLMAGGKRPFCGMVARALLRSSQWDEAMALFDVARHSVPRYSSWHMEYTYYWLACRVQVQGALDPSDLECAAMAIARGNILLQHGYSDTGSTERYLGRMHQLREEFAEAIPFLVAARSRLRGSDQVATDRALVLSYVKTGRLAEGRRLAENGVRQGEPYANLYRQILRSIPKTP